jgi:Uma2 family endonuclease
MSVSTQTNSEVLSIPLYRLKEIHDLKEIEGQGRKVFIELTEDEIYPSQHENEMGESTRHYDICSSVWNALNLFFKERSDVLVSVNLNLHYDENAPHQWFAPDIFVAFGVPNGERQNYTVWKEKVFPQVVFEVTSEVTYKNDVTDKVLLYQKLGAKEYYVIDSETFLPSPLYAFQRDQNNALRQIVSSENRVFSPYLGLEIVYSDEDVKLFNPVKQEFLPNLSEVMMRINESEKEIKRLKAELARLKGEN